MSHAPDMLSGMRAPRSVRLEDMKAAADRSDVLPEVAQAQADVTVYISRYRGYRVQITAPADIVDPYTGRKQIGKQIVAQFDGGVFRNDAKDPKTRKLIDDALQSNVFFGKFDAGLNAHFWLASEQNAVIEKRKIESARNTLRSLPRAEVEAFVASLKAGVAEDHELPPVVERTSELGV